MSPGAGRLRVGVDVGGTFTKAIAIDPATHELRAQAVVPTTHAARHGVADGAAAALSRLADQLGPARERVEVVAFSTTQAMNALLEGDVGRVGVIGIGADPEVRLARRRTRIGTVALAPGHALETEHEFLDATGGLDDAAAKAAVARLAAAGCTALAISGAFAVDAPAQEQRVAELARGAGLPACMGHELTGTYGLETRTLSAAINASILPVVARTAAVVESALARAGVSGRLLVLRGDGGAMSLDAFRRAPTFTVGSGPAAGVAAALHQLRLHDAVVLECGGTSSNVSLVRNGRTVLRSLRVMGRPTSLRAVDSWVVGAAGGSLARVRRRRLAETGPRSAHIAGLAYACFADPDDLDGARAELVAPRAGDPEAYLTVAAGGRRYALTATCAANALGLVGDTAYARGSQQSALLAFAAAGRRLGRPAEEVARRVLDGALDKIGRAVAEAAGHHDLPADAPLVALGGAGEALAGEVARRCGRRLVLPRHPEVLSSIGAALSLISAEVTRTAGEGVSTVAVAREAERACVDAGAAPASVTVETTYQAREGILRATATGSTALETGAADREPVDETAQLRAAAAALRIEAGRLSVAGATDFYRVFSENGSGGVAVVDARGAVPLAVSARRVLVGRGEGLLAQLGEAVGGATMHLGVATVPPRVAVISGPHILDLSTARRPEDIISGARLALDGERPAVAVVWR
jgi:N-methylhydantoinase A/oxoprolinase/acetone carboxylase beta subunit